MCRYTTIGDNDDAMSNMGLFEKMQKEDIENLCKDGFGLWAVCLRESGEMIGDCGLTLQNINGEFTMIPEVLGQDYIEGLRILEET